MGARAETALLLPELEGLRVSRSRHKAWGLEYLGDPGTGGLRNRFRVEHCLTRLS